MTIFTPAIPASGQTLGNSRMPILNNFASLRNTISAGSGNPGASDTPNHVDVNGQFGLTAGKHIFVEMPVVTAGTINLPLVNEGGLITQLLNGSSEMFYARDGVSSGGYLNSGRYQMTGPFVLNTGTPNGSMVLYGGMYLKWGSFTITGASQAISFAGGSFLNNAFTLILSKSSSIGGIGYSAFTTSGFTTSVSGTTSGTGNYIAIGN